MVDKYDLELEDEDKYKANNYYDRYPSHQRSYNAQSTPAIVIGSNIQPKSANESSGGFYRNRQNNSTETTPKNFFGSKVQPPAQPSPSFNLSSQKPFYPAPSQPKTGQYIPPHLRIKENQSQPAPPPTD